MKTAGEILKSERVKKGLSLEDVSQKTKIQVAFLQAIEERDYHKLPSSSYAKGLVRNYAQSLGFNIEKVLALFRREYEEKVPPVKIPPQPIDAPLITLTSTKVLTFFVSAAIIVFLLVLFWQYKSFAGKPVLFVSYPLNQTILDRPFVTVSGRTDKDAKVFINGEETRVSTEGVFEQTVNLNSGLNTIRVVARNKVGKENVVERIVEVQNG